MYSSSLQNPIANLLGRFDVRIDRCDNAYEDLLIGP